MKRDIAKYSYLLMLALIVSSVLNYLYQVFMGILLTKVEYGILGVVLSVFYIASVLTQNTFSWSATKFIAVEPSNAARYFRTAIFGNMGLALSVSALLILQAFHSKSYFLPVLIVCSSLIFTAILNSYTSLFRGLKSFNPIVAANILNPVLKLFVAVALVSLGFGVIGALFGLLLSLVFIVAYLMLYSRRLKLEKAGGWSFSMALKTLPISVIFLSISFLVNSSIVIFRLLAGSDVTAGNFNAALTIARVPFFVSSALVTVIFPYVSSEDFREVLSFESLKYVLLFVLPISITMAANPESWLMAFFSTKYLEAGGILKFLSLAIGFLSLVMVASSNLIALERFTFPSIVLPLFSAAYLILSLTFFRDSVGVALVLSATSFILAAAFLLYYKSRFYFKGSVKHTAKLILSYLLLYFLISPLGFKIAFTTRLFSLLHIAAALLIYLLAISVLGLFDKKDVEFLLSPFPEGTKDLAVRVITRLNSLFQ